MKNIILGMMLLIVTLSTQAQQKNKNAKCSVQVYGNCEHCKARIEKAAFSVKGVKSANWEVDSHQLKLILNEEKTTLLDVENAIAKIGHDTENVKANDSVYKKLPECCFYERK